MYTTIETRSALPNLGIRRTLSFAISGVTQEAEENRRAQSTFKAAISDFTCQDYYFIIYKLIRHVNSRNLVVELACNGAAYDVNVKIICSSFQKLS
jgi:hypothetical protein